MRSCIVLSHGGAESKERVSALLAKSYMSTVSLALLVAATACCYPHSAPADSFTDATSGVHAVAWTKTEEGKEQSEEGKEQS